MSALPGENIGDQEDVSRYDNHTGGNQSPAFNVALPALEGNSTLTDLAAHFDVHANQIENGDTSSRPTRRAFADGDRSEPPIDVKALHATIGQNALKLDFLSSALAANTCVADAPHGNHGDLPPAENSVASPCAALHLCRPPKLP